MNCLLMMEWSLRVTESSFQSLCNRTSLRKYTLDTKSQLRAKASVYWPGINKDIEQIVRRCSVCQSSQRRQSPEPLMPHDVPQRPWHPVGTDLFHFDGATYLLVADYYSKSMFVRKVNGPCTGSAVVGLTKQIFSEQGIPSKVMSDNGPQYDSKEYHRFAQDWGFDHTTSSPHFPQSNGFIERMVQTVKATLKKAKQSNMDPYLALLCLRTTPIDSALPSPAELLNGRKYRDNLPSKTRNNNCDKDSVYSRLLDHQAKQTEYHDNHGVRRLSPLRPGQHVTVQDHSTGKWTPAVVHNTCPEPRSYMVQMPDGPTLRHNRAHILVVEPKKKISFADPPVTGGSPPPCSPPTPKSILRGTTNQSSDDVSSHRLENANTQPPGQVTVPYQTRSGRTVNKPVRLIEEA